MALTDLVNPLKWIAPVGEVVTKGIEAFHGNKREQDQQQHEFRSQGLTAYAAEFTAARPNRTKWDSFVDGLNRLPRPAIVALVISYFVASWANTATFAAINAGLATVPEPMWWLMSAVVSFYFMAREMNHKRKASAFKEAAQAARELATIQQKALPSPQQALPVPAVANPSVAAWKLKQAEEDPPAAQDVEDEDSIQAIWDAEASA